ncbi:ABC transporter ATP-binding protein [Liquorilactobacillus satsumensis]|uniref:Multidrug protein lipid ABC transporter family ATP-binding and permease n=1 Tax=Liquorilactobacillus satsumensis DSM 16230 = JCM 12392 TaxID=1423801 RepID=A0A0R1UXC6_9LACO|nr:ABC transporter ATP-binding protein [Liquorilactobacillus satsumensis]KRL97726.1 multidrug protein lipid ABC transporter family ATP-binding and permease [Liquorilactobacillus satsumensis DSM 16230 = JCM 12392]MCC7666515.1 ABC transporter ATP-binding protein [Liquorilactobacillus satsumensis]MCP9312926.1 ABC transporter ATP-binding protein [Liquorilactobacillus satsumensis]MCP9357519.1 ABC transporter ATP-binding protein [Liquorilactobacillus satsumensis]MCP9360040.1 ABC transporter ATP-bind
MKGLKDSLGYFKHYLQPYWKGLVFVVGLTVLSTWAQIEAPIYLGKAITALSRYLIAYSNPLTRPHASLSSFHNAIWLILIFFILTVVTMLISSLWISYINGYSTNNMQRGLFKKLQKMTVRYFDSHQDGKILSLFTSDLDNIFNAMNQAVFELISQIILYIGVLWIMFSLNVKLAFATVASTPFVILIAYIIIRKARFYIDKQQDEISGLNGYINEQINGQKIIITNGLQKKSVAEFNVLNERVRHATFKGQLYSGLLFPVMQGLSLLNLAIVIAYGSWMVVSGDLGKAVGIGLIVTFVQYSQQYFQPITQITSMYSMIQLALTGAKRLAHVLKQPEEERNANGSELKEIREGVELQDVHFGYDPDKEILHGINIKVEKGKMIALVGPTGSGKTTVMNLLNRFYDVTSGKVLFDGQDTREFSLFSLRQNIGIVLQDSILFTGTIADNIKFGKPNATDQQMIAAAKQAHIHDYIESLPDGYQTKVDDENSVLSVGQKQLLSIARTLLTDPAFLILDEATSNVDMVTEEKIKLAMDNVIAGRTSFVIAHRLKTIVGADQIIVLKDGQVIEQGKHEQLLTQKGFYYNLYTNQMVFE